MVKLQVVVVRGDIRPVLFSVEDFYGEYTDLPFDEISFVVRRGTSDKTILFKKTLKDMACDKTGHYRITIKPEDTDGLVYGRYIFQLTLEYGDVLKQTTVGSFYVYNGMSGVPTSPDTKSYHAGVDYLPLKLATPVKVNHDTWDYDYLVNKPSINGVTLQGDVDLGEILKAGDYVMTQQDILFLTGCANTEEDLQTMFGESDFAELMGDIVCENQIRIDHDFTLELAGHALTGIMTEPMFLIDGATLTIATNGIVGCLGELCEIVNDGKIVIQDGIAVNDHGEAE